MNFSVALSTLFISGRGITVIFTRQLINAAGNVVMQDNVQHFFAADNLATFQADLKDKLGTNPLATDLAIITKHALAVNPGVTPQALQAIQTPWPAPE